MKKSPSNIIPVIYGWQSAICFDRSCGHLQGVFYKKICRRISPARAWGKLRSQYFTWTYSDVSVLALLWVWKLVTVAKTARGFLRWRRVLNY